MNQKLLVVLLLLILQGGVDACMFPNSGPDYDQLIEITELNEKNHFRVKLPNELDDGKGVFVSLDYSKPTKSNKGLKYSNENYVVLYSHCFLKKLWAFITFQGTKILDLEFEAEHREGFIVTVNAHWPGVCSSYGKSKPLNVEP